MNYESQQIKSPLEEVRHFIAKNMAEPSLDIPREILCLWGAQLEETVLFLRHNTFIPDEFTEVFCDHMSFIGNVAEVLKRVDFMRLHNGAAGISIIAA